MKLDSVDIVIFKCDIQFSVLIAEKNAGNVLKMWASMHLPSAAKFYMELVEGIINFNYHLKAPFANMV